MAEHNIRIPLETFEKALNEPNNTTVRLSVKTVCNKGDIIFQHEWALNGQGSTGRYLKYIVQSTSHTPLAHYANVNCIEVYDGRG